METTTETLTIDANETEDTASFDGRKLQELTAVFERVIWSARGEGRRFVIAKVFTEAESGQRTELSVKGECDPGSMLRGVAYRFYGKHENHPKYGRGFSFKAVVQQEPHGRTGVVQYLERFADGLGPVYAGRIYDKFGSDAVRILRSDPETVANAIPSISLDRATKAAVALQVYAATEETRIELVNLLAGRGFPGELTEDAIKRWGCSAARRIKADPFTLMVNKLPGAGFARCDRLYLDLGLPPTKLKRQLLCIWKAVQDNGDGSTWHSIETAAAAIQQNIGGLPVERVNWKRAIRLGVRAKWLVTAEINGRKCIAVNRDAEAEAKVAADVVRLLLGEPGWEWPDVDSIHQISDHQRETLGKCLRAPIAILCGTPGTGKTYATAQLLQAVIRSGLKPWEIAVCAPTGKAALRIEEALGNAGVEGLSVGTVHRLLGVNRNGHDGNGWGFIHNARNPLPYNLVVIEEASMLDAETASSLIQAIPTGSRVLLVGDPYQLPPVSHGAPLRDLLASKAVPSGLLTEVLRNGGRIVQACLEINGGRPYRPSRSADLSIGENLIHWPTKSPALTKAEVCRRIQAAGVVIYNGKPIDPVWDVQVITALNEKSDVSRVKLNESLQAALNPHGDQVKGNPFRLGDKVICTSNKFLPVATESGALVAAEDDDHGIEDKEPLKDFVANGEIGIATRIDAKYADVTFLSPRRIIRFPTMGKEAVLDLAYAITFHKSQGSQWPIVILIADRAAARVACREIWYTGISRAELLCITAGDMSAITSQCRRVALASRRTRLAELITKGLDDAANAATVTATRDPHDQPPKERASEDA